MGNPASVIRKKTEKRRKKFEARLGPAAYLPKEEREKVNAALAKVEAEAAAAKAERVKKAKAAAEAKKAAKKAAGPKKPDAAPAEGK